MTEWKKTSCPICWHNCGLEVQTDRHRISKVRPDRNHPRTKGYICRKGMKIAHYQDHKERLTHPLKKEGARFVKISWGKAISEIAERLKETRDKYGPRSLAYMGGGGQGCHLDGGFGRTLMEALGSKYHYSAAAQEWSGMFWINGRAYGRQGLELLPDLDQAENVLVIGWNGYVSNAGINRPAKRINEFSKDPHKQLIVVDPLLSETAKRANKHLKMRIGTLALFLKSLIAIILQEGWENRNYIADHCQGLDEIAPWFKNFDVASALQVCGLDYNQVKEVAQLYATRPTALKSDLGLLMDRQSTLNSYLEMILMAICGRIGTPGGNVFHGHVRSMRHSDDRHPDTWRTLETDIPAIAGFHPPNVAPEEILSQREDRLRAMIISHSNPLRSYADTLAYERAFRKLELLVTIEISMSETAQISHYVLPGRSAFEKYDTTFFALTFPEIYFQVRHPSCESRGDTLEEGEIHMRLAEALGILPEIPHSLTQASRGDRKDFAAELMTLRGQGEIDPGLLPFVVAKTLGKSLKSAHLALVWALIMTYPQQAADDLARAGYEVTPLLGETLFQKLVEHPEGILIGKVDPDNNLDRLKTPDKKIHLFIGEMADWMQEIEPEAEKAALKNEEFPFVLVAGRHFPYTANTLLRDPAWNDNKTRCTLLMSNEDAQALNIADGEEAWLTTAASEVKIPVEISAIAPPGTVVIPHGFGLDYDGKVHGVNVNRLTKNTHRDRLAGTPLHRYVPCRVEAV